MKNFAAVNTKLCARGAAFPQDERSVTTKLQSLTIRSEKKFLTFLTVYNKRISYMSIIPKNKRQLSKQYLLRGIA